nr:condensin complex subunit 1-like [Oncorhynchus nerka]
MRVKEDTRELLIQVVGGLAVSLPSLLNASLTEILESDSYRQSIITAPSKALPLNRYSEVMGLAVGRLMDKSINVVKSAIQLLAAFIAHNPYSCKLSSADLKKPLEMETDKLRA